MGMGTSMGMAISEHLHIVYIVIILIPKSEI